jgi:hypothetical protein
MGGHFLEHLDNDSTRDKIEALYNSLENNPDQWSEWETEFIESMFEKVKYDVIDLSSRQMDKLFDLYDKV